MECGGWLLVRVEEPGVFVQDLELARVVELRLNGGGGLQDGDGGWAELGSSWPKGVRLEV